MGANWALYAYAAMGNGTAEMIQKIWHGRAAEKIFQSPGFRRMGRHHAAHRSRCRHGCGGVNHLCGSKPDGTYSLTGNKIFITNGEHDLCDNIIHPVLARIEGDPAGTKGISIFIVPKFFVNDDGSLGDRNDIVCTGTEEKMGIHASATCSMAMGTKGKCIGYLLAKNGRV